MSWYTCTGCFEKLENTDYLGISSRAWVWVWADESMWEDWQDPRRMGQNEFHKFEWLGYVPNNEGKELRCDERINTWADDRSAPRGDVLQDLGWRSREKRQETRKKNRYNQRSSVHSQGPEQNISYAHGERTREEQLNNHLWHLTTSRIGHTAVPRDLVQKHQRE